MKVVNQIVFCLFAVSVMAASSFADDATNYLKIGIIAGQRGDFAGAYSDFTMAISVKPDCVQAYVERGLAAGALAKNDGNLAEASVRAVADYNKAIELDPAYAPAYYNRGVVMQANGEFENAKADFIRVTKLKTDLMLLAQAYLHLGELKKGENDQMGAAYCFSAAYYYRGISEAEQMQTNNALADLAKAIELRPNFPMAYYDRGRLEQTTGDLDDAMADYNKSIELDPKFSGSFLNRGNIKRARNDIAGALTDYNEAIELDPRNAKAWMNRGIAQALQGDATGSKADFQQAVQINPEIRALIEINGYSIN